MKVYCYFEQVHSLQPADSLIALWKENWTRAGFEPQVLTSRDAKDHPGFPYFIGHIDRYPTTNPREYERACFIRHLAMASVGGGVLLDYDVHPNPKGPKPQFETQEKFLFLEPTRVPCAIVGTAEGYEDFCDAICDYDGKESHISDMIIARKTKFPFSYQCVEHLCSGAAINDDPGDGWKTAPMIHFSNGSMWKSGLAGGNKAQIIQRILTSL